MLNHKSINFTLIEKSFYLGISSFFMSDKNSRGKVPFTVITTRFVEQLLPTLSFLIKTRSKNF